MSLCFSHLCVYVCFLYCGKSFVTIEMDQASPTIWLSRHSHKAPNCTSKFMQVCRFPKFLRFYVGTASLSHSPKGERRKE